MDTEVFKSGELEIYQFLINESLPIHIGNRRGEAPTNEKSETTAQESPILLRAQEVFAGFAGDLCKDVQISRLVQLYWHTVIVVTHLDLASLLPLAFAFQVCFKLVFLKVLHERVVRESAIRRLTVIEASPKDLSQPNIVVRTGLTNDS